MDTEERVEQALEMFRRVGGKSEFNLYLQKLLQEDPLAFSVVEVYISIAKHQFPLAVRRGVRLLRALRDNPRLTCRLLISIGRAYRGMGEMGTGELWFMRALEMAELIQDKEGVSQANLQLYIARVLKAEYEQAYKDFLKYRKYTDSWRPHVAYYFLAVIALVKGQPDEAIKFLTRFLEAETKTREYFSVLEIKALALRILGRFPEAMETLIQSATGYTTYDSAYSAFPLGKALEISRLTGLEPPPYKLIREVLSLARKGSWGERAAAEEIEALLRKDDAEAAEGLYEAAKNYLRAYQNIEAVFSSLTAAYLAWKADSPVFTKALKLIAPLVPLHPGFKKDPLLGNFMAEMEPFITKALKPYKDKEGIRAYLIGEFKVFVDGEEISFTGWHNNAARRAFVYLLLSPKHRIPVDHLFYLLWPRRAYNRKNKRGLYTAINVVRRRLGNYDLLTQKGDFYQLEDTWTDLGELENLVRLAEATIDPAQKEEYLARARDLAKGELLPEFPYDKHIEEYRQYYERLRKRLGLG